MKKFIKFRLFLVVAAIFVCAAVFMSDPFTNKAINQSPAAGIVTGSTVVIADEGIALGIPGSAAATDGFNWTAVGIAVAVINLLGALVVIFITGNQRA